MNQPKGYIPISDPRFLEVSISFWTLEVDTFGAARAALAEAARQALLDADKALKLAPHWARLYQRPSAGGSSECWRAKGEIHLEFDQLGHCK